MSQLTKKARFTAIQKKQHFIQSQYTYNVLTPRVTQGVMDLENKSTVSVITCNVYNGKIFQLKD